MKTNMKLILLSIVFFATVCDCRQSAAAKKATGKLCQQPSTNIVFGKLPGVFNVAYLIGAPAAKDHFLGSRYPVTCFRVKNVRTANNKTYATTISYLKKNATSQTILDVSQSISADGLVTLSPKNGNPTSLRVVRRKNGVLIVHICAPPDNKPLIMIAYRRKRYATLDKLATKEADTFTRTAKKHRIRQKPCK